MTSNPVDLRDLPPPEPLLRILAALEAGQPGPFVFLLAREPRPLYPMLSAQGWRHDLKQADAGFELTVFRDAAKP